MKGGLPTWFAGPGGVRGLHRAIATAKSRYTKVARPATAKATVSSTTKFSMINRFRPQIRVCPLQYVKQYLFNYSFSV